jgi:hypothetical protein
MSYTDDGRDPLEPAPLLGLFEELLGIPLQGTLLAAPIIESLVRLRQRHADATYPPEHVSKRILNSIRREVSKVCGDWLQEEARQFCDAMHQPLFTWAILVAARSCMLMPELRNQLRETAVCWLSSLWRGRVDVLDWLEHICVQGGIAGDAGNWDAPASLWTDTVRSAFASYREEIDEYRRTLGARAGQSVRVPWRNPPRGESLPPVGRIPPGGRAPLVRVTEPPEDVRLDVVDDPNGFQPVTWAKALEKIGAVPVEALAGTEVPSLLFDGFRSDECKSVVRVTQHAELPEALWVVGDLHSDLLALVNAWAYIERVSHREGKEPAVVFLGDIIDRGDHGHETLVYLLELTRKYPGRIAVLPGNHDLIAWDESGHRFLSPVEQADYVGGLNALLQMPDAEQDQDRLTIGRLAAKFFAEQPRALVLPDGTFLTHAGFPHTDLLDRIQLPADLDRDECRQDFAWLRISESSRKKRPNRGNKGCEFGYEDFSRFCNQVGEVLRQPLRWMLRGHDHIIDRFRLHQAYREHRVVTLNTMCRLLDGELVLNARGPMRACVARLRPGKLPQIHRLPVPAEEVERAYPKPTEPAEQADDAAPPPTPAGSLEE